MRLSWNEVRVRAATFAEEWSKAVRETSETHSFYNAFFRVFGVERRWVARYEEHVAKLDDSQASSTCSGPASLSSSRKAPAAISRKPTVRPANISTHSRNATGSARFQ